MAAAGGIYRYFVHIHVSNRPGGSDRGRGSRGSGGGVAHLLSPRLSGLFGPRAEQQGRRAAVLHTYSVLDYPGGSDGGQATGAAGGEFLSTIHIPAGPDVMPAVGVHYRISHTQYLGQPGRFGPRAGSRAGCIVISGSLWRVGLAPLPTAASAPFCRHGRSNYDADCRFMPIFAPKCRRYE